MPRVFISYRRKDSKSVAEKIELYLTSRRRFNVFVDYKIKTGDEWKLVIPDKIKRCDVMLVLIGSEWVNELEYRRTLIDDDWVVEELKLGLPRSSVTVIPVLLDGTPIPDVGKLKPDGIEALADRHAFELRTQGAAFRMYAEYLEKRIRHAVARRVLLMIALAVVFLLIAGGTVMAATPQGRDLLDSIGIMNDSDATPTSAPMLTDTPKPTDTLTPPPTATETPKPADTSPPTATATETPKPPDPPTEALSTIPLDFAQFGEVAIQLRPVTSEDFAAFIEGDAPAYWSDPWWSDEGIIWRTQYLTERDEITMLERFLQPDTVAVTRASYHEAQSYCRWRYQDYAGASLPTVEDFRRSMQMIRNAGVQEWTSSVFAQNIERQVLIQPESGQELNALRDNPFITGGTLPTAFRCKVNVDP